MIEMFKFDIVKYFIGTKLNTIYTTPVVRFVFTDPPSSSALSSGHEVMRGNKRYLMQRMLEISSADAYFST